MNALHEIINILSSEDKRAFTAYLSKKNKRYDVQNINLFMLLEDQNTGDTALEERFASAGAYHALRKRLFSSLVAFLGKRRFESDASEESAIMQSILGARTLLEHKLYKEGFKTLAKAEAKATALEHFSLLNDIYHTWMQFSHFSPSDDLDAIIAKSRANRSKLEHEEQMNIAYALLRRELAEIYHNGKVIDFRAFIEQVMQQQGVSAEALTFRSLYQILFIANEYASLNNNFRLVEPFMGQAYSFITAKESLGEKQLYYHIYILYLLANMHFRNGRFAESTAFLQKMETQMQKQGRKYHGRFLLRYSLLVALNQNYSGSPAHAIETLQDALQHKGDEEDMADLHLCLAVVYLQQGAGSEASKQMQQFNRTDAWYEKHLGMDWAIRKKLIDVLLYLQVGHIDYALLHLDGFRKRYKKYLERVNEHNVLEYMDLLRTLIKNPEQVRDDAYLNTVEYLLTDVQETGDIIVLSFVGWLKAVILRKKPYDIIMELIG